MTNPIATQKPTGLVVVDTSQAVSGGPSEVRYDLELVPVDPGATAALAALSGRWQATNSRLVCDRLEVCK